jgi:hypothetical protein
MVRGRERWIKGKGRKIELSKGKEGGKESKTGTCKRGKSKR